MRILSAIGRALAGTLGAAVGLIGTMFDAFARAAGVMPRQQAPLPSPAMLERAKERHLRVDPILESLKQLRRNAVTVIGWAADARQNRMAVVPAELPPDIQQWCAILSRREQERLCNSSINGVMHHMNGTAPIDGIIQVEATQRPGWKLEPPAPDRVMASPGARIPVPSF